MLWDNLIDQDKQYRFETELEVLYIIHNYVLLVALLDH